MMKDKRIYPERPIASVAGVVVSSKGILLMKRKKPPYEGLWNIISGLIEIGETQEQAIIREVREETGLECRVFQFLDTSDLIIRDTEGKVEYQYLVNVYLLLVQGKSKFHGEAIEIQWFAPEKIPDDKMPPDVAKALRKMSSKLNQIMKSVS
jgi:8-oxo-dGTP diphosphatase